ncbi:melanopsin-like [Limulus polyphemus]|uniref:Melanopsin-like n=1 Tax=Limulus polyphemus TaxID=6850 RepID=A0ABM1T428_LIMPO|nr:melanopsin-like [Limulus polyphemus]
MNLILLNMSVCDMTISVTGTPLTFVAAVYRRWIFGDLVCEVYGFAMSVVGMTQIGTLTAIAVERYIIMSKPYSSTRMTPKRSGLIIACTWFYSLGLCLPPLFGWSHYILEPPGIGCSVDWLSTTKNNVSYIIYLFTVGFAIPVSVMVFCYSHIIWKVRKAPRRTGKSHAERAEQRLTLMVATMIISTLTAWTPYAVVSLIMALGFSHVLGPLSTVSPAIFAKSSVVYNPIVYFFLNPQIQKAMMNCSKCYQTNIASQPQQEISLVTNNLTGRWNPTTENQSPLRSEQNASFLKRSNQ